MDKTKPNVSSGNGEEQRSEYTVRGVVRAYTGDRASGEWSSQVVHTQESLRLLDLRLHSVDGFDVRHLSELLESLGCAITITIAEREIDRLK